MSINTAIKVLEDGIVLSPQAGTILRLEGGLKLVLKHLKAAPTLPAVAGPCAHILAAATATSSVTQQALAKEKGLGHLLLTTCGLHVRDPAIAGPLCEAMAHISRNPKGAAQLECDALLPVLQELLVTYLGNWPVFGWSLKLMKSLAKYEYVHFSVGPGAVSSVLAAAGVRTVARGGSGMLSSTGEGVRLLLGVARVLARMPEQKKLLKRVSRTLWLLCPHVLVPMPPLEPLVGLPPKDAPHLAVASAARPPSAWQLSRSLSGSGGMAVGNSGAGGDISGGSQSGQGLGQTAEPFHGYGTSLDCEMMVSAVGVTGYA
ncbi:hypothetical protein GPECTOR_52g28 [Gonium pectorale]|uniref:Uncharacterized protein n=1 Tax=Gonium pectorale TaxID=33097 RepID=A0A150G6Y0_GONPE|nr:hypothetical protein GPECTOR_52g28 [Gonium pectorale]|eukprot:KXZ45626.1 hypothetical protein GPECTOR_52g28 [Gonium pectorale]